MTDSITTSSTTLSMRAFSIMSHSLKAFSIMSFIAIFKVEIFSFSINSTKAFLLFITLYLWQIALSLCYDSILTPSTMLSKLELSIIVFHCNL
jgi:hypothetical protein